MRIPKSSNYSRSIILLSITKVYSLSVIHLGIFCVDTGRSTGGHITFIQGGAVDYGSHLPVPVAMTSGEAEYIYAAVACMRASHLRMLIYDLKYLCSEDYDGDNIEYDPAKIIMDNKATISMAKYNKETARNRHVARRFHYVRQGTALNEHKFH